MPKQQTPPDNVLSQAAQPDPVKKIGDVVLSTARLMIDAMAGESVDLRFLVNRWVYARLQQDERAAKAPIKKALWDSGKTTCQGEGCDKEFPSLKGVDLHRVDDEKAYSFENCVLLCNSCHKKMSRAK